MSNVLTFRLFGGLTISRADHPVSGFHSRKERALLCYLVVTGRSHSRSFLAGLFWGDLPERRALGNLRRVLTHLRAVAGDHLLIDRQTVAFDLESDYWLDVALFEEKVAKYIRTSGQGESFSPHPSSARLLELGEAMELYQGDFMAGFYVRGCFAFEEWALGEQERLRGLAGEALRALIDLHRARGEYPAAIVYTRRLLALDPWREEAHRELMRLLALSGQRSAALAQYEECRRLLKAELGLEPLEETTTLYEQLVHWETDRLVHWLPNLPVSQCTNLPFKGRGEEHARLVGCWERSRRGTGTLALVEGEAGVGKTRLVEEVIRYAEAQGGVVLRGRCYEFGVSVPYQPIAEALRGWLSKRAEMQGSSSSLASVWLVELSRLLPELRQMYPDLSEPALVSGEAARQRLFEAIVRFLPPTFGASCILFLDDLHWADPSTLDLLHYLVRQLSGIPMWIVGTYRPEEVQLNHPLVRLRQGLGRDRLVDRLSLDSLSAEIVREIACSLVGEEAGAAFGDFLYHESEGNPFILIEVVSDLQEQGLLRGGEDDRWVWEGPPAAMTLPDGVQDVVLQRVGRLSEPAQRLLTLAAVIGQQFDAPLLQAAAGRDTDAVDESLDEWLVRCLVRRSPISNLQYDFGHDKIRAVVYHEAGPERRQILHRRVGEALERLFPARVEEWAGLLAHHWELAQELGRTTEYLLRAGDQARLVYAHQEAIDYYRRALAYLREQGDVERERAAQTLMKLGLTYHNAFDFQQARQAYDEGFALWQRAGAVRSVLPSPLASRVLRVRWLEPTTMDPTMSPDAHTDCLMAHFFSGLVELGPGMDVVPDVARTWEMSEGGRKYVFHLRDDVRWSDGTPVTARDFEYAWKRALDPASGSSTASFMHDLKGAGSFHRGEGSREDVGVQALDEVTLSVELEEPAGYFLQLLTHAPYYPVPRHVVELHGETWTDLDHIVTNGPFRLETWNRGELVVLSRNPEYHGLFRGNLQQVKLFPLAEWSARLQMYDQGELDVLGIKFFPSTERESARQRYAQEYVSGPSLETYYVAFDASRPPFDDVRVRRAFVMATDREMLADGVMQGYVSPATGGFVPPGMPGHSPEIGLPYDPVRARRLLAEAGYPGGHGFPTVNAYAFRAIESRSEYLQALWQENLEIEIAWETMEWATFLDRLGKEPPHLFNAMWAADYPDPDNFLRVSYARTWAEWRHETYTRLVEKARRVADQEERMRLYRRADKILVEEAPILPLTYEQDHLLVKPWVSRYPTSAVQTSFWKDVVIEPRS
jgi:ABC-type oligopeptide transport system substrate-binding subunit/DNA-binding SARP family transcriptional activator